MAVISNAIDSTGSRRRQNVQTTAARPRADTIACSAQAKASGRPTMRAGVERRGDLQEQHAVAVLLQEVLQRHDVR